MAKSPSNKTAKPAGGAKVAPAGPPRQPGVERRRNHPTRAKDGYYQIVLTQVVPNLGKPGELVKVRPGYARNYLLPQGMATLATPHRLRLVQQHKARIEQAEAARAAEMRSLAMQLAQRKYLIYANANPEGHLYGSVNADQIAATLKADNFPIEADQVRIPGPLKDLGQYSIDIRLGAEIEAQIELWVVPTHAEETV